MNIYICSQKIINNDFLDLFVVVEPISLMGKLREFLLFSSEVDCTDRKGSVNFKHNQATNHFIIFGKDKKTFSEQVLWLCNTQNIFIFNAISKEEMAQKEKIFFQRDKRVKEYMQSLKDEYDIHKANKNIADMAKCIKMAEDIVFGKIKVN